MTKKGRYKKSLKLIDSWLCYQMHSNEIHGSAVGIFVDDELIFNKVYGYADFETKTKLTESHLFRIASQTKLFTATAIMKLAEDSKLSVDDKVSKHLDWFESDEDDNLQNITIKHLLTHSSGIQCDVGSSLRGNQIPPNIEDIQKLVKKGISKFKTDEILKYSNLGFAILGLIIESVAGKGFNEFIQDSILNPLEMNETAMDINEKNIPDNVIGYDRKLPRKNRERVEQSSSGVMNPAEGILSNVGDLVKFFQAHMFGNHTLLPDELKKEMQKNQFEYNNEKRGLGFWLGQVPNGSSIVYHIGGYQGFRSCSALYPEDKMIIIVLTNANDGPATNWLMAIKSILDLYASYWNDFLVDSKEEKPDFSELIGYYKTSGDVSYFTQIGDTLVSIIPSNNNPLQTLITYEHKEDFLFISSREMNFAKIGEEICFISGEDGQKILLEYDNSMARRFDLNQFIHSFMS